jgi:RNase P subunit RPR2
MKTITIRRVDVQFDADQVTQGTSEQQARQAVELIKQVSQKS